MTKVSEKPASIFLDVEVEPEDELLEIIGPEKIQPEIEITDIERRKKVLYVVCPFCGMHRVIEKKGTNFLKKAKHWESRVFEPEFKQGKFIKSERSKYYNPYKEVSFNKYNFKEEPFISIRVKIGGKGEGGFYEIAYLTIEDVLKLSEKFKEKFIKYLLELREQAEKFLKYLDEIGIKSVS